MLLFKRTALCTAILAVSSFNTVTHADEGFIEGSSLDAVLRNVYFNRDGRDTSRYDNREWVQGLQFNFKSGYFADIVGFDASYYGAWELDSPGDSATHLPTDKSSKRTKIDRYPGKSPASITSETNDIGFLGQAYVKVKLGDDNVNFNFKHGRMRHDNNLIQGSGSRAVPSSVYGSAADVNIHGLKLHCTYLTQASWRSQGHFEHFEAAGKTVNYIQSYGLAYEFDNGFGFEYDWGESNSYLEGQQFKAYYTFDLAENTKLYLEGIHHRIQENGNAFVTAKSSSGTTNADGYESNNTSFLTKLTIDELTLKAAYQFTKNGDFLYDWDANIGYGGYNSNIPYWSDYAYKDEKAAMVGFEYDFSGLGVPGLTLDASYRKGFNLDKDNNGIATVNRAENEWGRAMVVAYEFQAQPLKGLKFKWVNFTHRSSRSLGNEDVDGNQIYFDYTFNIF